MCRWSLVLLFVSSASAAELCYPPLGCFSMSAPWRSLLRPMPPPSEPAAINTQFYLYTRKSMDRFVVTTRPQLTVAGSDFDGHRKTFVICHGYASDSNTTWVTGMKDALLQQEDGNVFIVDWANGAQIAYYFQAASNARVVGAEGARLINFLIRNNGLNPGDVHLIGHSLGAHVVGYMAKGTKNTGRVTGLDPAQLGFEGWDPKVRLDISDAAFVEAIHTDGRPFMVLFGLGIMEKIGHVDIYMNGGCRQPGCLELPATQRNESTGPSIEDVSILGEKVGCSHSLVTSLWTEAASNPGCTIWAHRAEYSLIRQNMKLAGTGPTNMRVNPVCSATTCVPLGLNTPKYPARGVFIAETNSKVPYCKPDPSGDKTMSTVAG